VAESHAKLNELTESSFRKGELASAVSPESGVEYFEDLVKVYRSTGPGLKAEVVLALLDHARGNVQPAIQRLLRVLKSDPRTMKPELEAAQKALDEISKAGDTRIEGALAGDKSAAKEILKKLAKDYAGTEAAKHATDAPK
jgi:lipopolysaccharide biosynthesis regulator YciM